MLCVVALLWYCFGSSIVHCTPLSDKPEHNNTPPPTHTHTYPPTYTNPHTNTHTGKTITRSTSSFPRLHHCPPQALAVCVSGAANPAYMQQQKSVLWCIVRVLVYVRVRVSECVCVQMRDREFDSNHLFNLKDSPVVWSIIDGQF